MTTTDQGITCKHGLPHGHPCSQCGAEAISSRTFPQHKDLLDAGYAPGNYTFKCMDCGYEAVGDKRARRCLPCAEKRVVSRASPVSSNAMNRPQSPQRFFLNAPKQKDSECYVLNFDYMELDAYCVSLLRERDRLRALVQRAHTIIGIREAALPTHKGKAWLEQAAGELNGEHSAVETESRHPDTERLDWLDTVTERMNRRYGTVYGWRYDINHNRAALTDHNLPALTIRQAIDECMATARPPETPDDPIGPCSCGRVRERWGRFCAKVTCADGSEHTQGGCNSPSKASEPPPSTGE